MSDTIVSAAYAPVALVMLLALLQFFGFMIAVGRARYRYGVKAPATSGNEDFERVYRVQMNTLEMLAIFVPSLWSFAIYISPSWALPRRSTPTTTPSMINGSSRRLTLMGSKSGFSGMSQTMGPSCL